MSYPRFFFFHFIHSTTFFVVLAFCEAQRPNPIRSCLLGLTVVPCGFPLQRWIINTACLAADVSLMAVGQKILAALNRNPQVTLLPIKKICFHRSSWAEGSPVWCNSVCMSSGPVSSCLITLGIWLLSLYATHDLRGCWSSSHHICIL